MTRWIIVPVAALAVLLPASAVAEPGKTISSMQSSHSPQWRGLVAACDSELSAYVRTFYNQNYGTFEETRYVSARLYAGSAEGMKDLAELRTKVAGGGSIAGGELGVLFRCYMRARIAQLSGTGSTSPRVAVKPAPALVAAKKFPPARAVKMAAWSPKAMPTDNTTKLSPQFAAERADALANCSAPIKQVAAQTLAPGSVHVMNLLIEQIWLADDDMALSTEAIKVEMGRMDNVVVSGSPTANRIAGLRAARCVYQRRLAQLEGSPLSSGAVDGTLNPFTIGISGTTPAPQGKDARIIASNGRSAMDCVKLEQLASGDSRVGGGGRVLVNRCSNEVEISWCYSPGDCSTETGSSWTVQPGRSWPINAEGEIRWAACHGRDTAGFVKGSYGLRYYCKAPAAKPKA